MIAGVFVFYASSLCFGGYYLWASLTGNAVDEPGPTAIPIPPWRHPLGTNDIGQDMFSRILYGDQISLEMRDTFQRLPALLIWHSH